MTTRGRKQARSCYVYRIFDGCETVYVGKGSGRRLETQKRRFNLDGEVIERDLNDDAAFARERHWIKQLMPSANVSPGGNGGRTVARPKPRLDKSFAEIARVGQRRYAARFLLTRLSEVNCSRYGVSKVDIDRLREVANGPWC